MAEDSNGGLYVERHVMELPMIGYTPMQHICPLRLLHYLGKHPIHIFIYVQAITSHA